MKVIPVAGGVARTVVKDSIATFGGADWADNGRIYFTNSARGLSRVAAGGGIVTLVSSPDSASGVKEHDFPDVLPGSRQAFVMLWRGSLGSNRVGVVDLGSGAVTELAEGSYARYLPPGLLVIPMAGIWAFSRPGTRGGRPGSGAPMAVTAREPSPESPPGSMKSGSTRAAGSRCSAPRAPAREPAT